MHLQIIALQNAPVAQKVMNAMINAGTWQVSWLDDDWTVVTDDGSLSAHYENTVLITDGEPEILTLSL